MSLFSAIDLRYTFGAHVALDGVTFSIEDGERVAVIGANGSGKSTLLRLLDGLYEPRGGRLFFRDVELTRERLSDDRFGFSFRRRVGYLFQSSDVQLFNATVFDEVAFGPLQLGMGDEEAREAVDSTLERLAIRHLSDRPPHRLSCGEKKRVALASVLVLGPDVLLLDEPSAGLDPRGRRQLIELLVGIGAPGSLIVSTHDLELAESLTTRSLLLQAGRLEADMPTGSLIGAGARLEEAGVA